MNVGDATMRYLAIQIDQQKTPAMKKHLGRLFASIVDRFYWATRARATNTDHLARCLLAACSVLVGNKVSPLLYTETPEDVEMTGRDIGNGDDLSDMLRKATIGDKPVAKSRSTEAKPDSVFLTTLRASMDAAIAQTTRSQIFEVPATLRRSRIDTLGFQIAKAFLATRETKGVLAARVTMLEDILLQMHVNFSDATPTPELATLIQAQSQLQATQPLSSTVYRNWPGWMNLEAFKYRRYIQRMRKTELEARSGTRGFAGL